MSAPTSENASQISVVVAAWAGEARLAACLDSLAPQLAAGAELIVAGALGPDLRARIQARHPSARLLAAPADADVPTLRALGAAQARGRLVALIEDHCTVGPDWREALCAAHARGARILGGPVDNGVVERAFDWALFFCEYGVHLRPAPDGPADAVSGVNVAYDRAALARVADVWRHALYETEVNAALAPDGDRPWIAADAWVRSHLPMRLGEAMAHLFDGGRHFGGVRSANERLPLRLARVASAPAVAALLFARIHRRVAERDPRRLRALWRGAGYCALLLGAWSAGEAVGALRGPERR